MNIFVIHSTADYNSVEKIISSLKQKEYSMNTLILKNGNCFWKIEATSKIKNSEMVIFVVGENSYKSPYIAWEIKKAIKLKKPIFILKLNEKNELHNALYVADSFTGERKNYGTVTTEDEIVTEVKNHNYGIYELFNSQDKEIDTNILLEQYKLFLQTSEDLVNRRQNVNSFYLSLSSALVTVMGILFAMDFQKISELFIGIAFCIIGVILSISWAKLLSNYGNLNSSKMKIISYIEKRLPLSLFDTEWAILANKLNKRRYKSFTESERLIPRLFMYVYFSVIIVIIISYFFS